jgi:acyl carrier protein
MKDLGVPPACDFRGGKRRVADQHEDGSRPMSSLKELQDLIQEKYGLDPTKLDPAASMRESGVDSLALVEFVWAVEDRFSISIPDDYTQIESLSDLAAVVDKVRAAQTA